jgi:hypothetical protein
MKILSEVMFCVLIVVSSFIYADDTTNAPAPEAEKVQEQAQTQAPAETQTAPAEKTEPVTPAVQPKQESEKDKAAAEYDIKLRSLEEKINSLKDKIFRSKQRLAILQETVLTGSIAGSSVAVIHKNSVGSIFKLISAVYYLDDAVIYKKIDAPDELAKKEIRIYDAAVIPGPHHLSVYYIFRGAGFGFFSYMKGYSYQLKSGYSFSVDEGNLVEIVASPMDNGATFNIDDRLYVSFTMSRRMFESTNEMENK